MPALEVGDRLASRADALEEVASVAAELVEFVAGAILDNTRPLDRGVAFALARRAAGRMRAPKRGMASVGAI